jgi:hypothetical protein
VSEGKPSDAFLLSKCLQRERVSGAFMRRNLCIVDSGYTEEDMEVESFKEEGVWYRKEKE